MFENRISADTKKTRSWRGGGERVYVLYAMVVTFPTCQAEMLALKLPLPLKRYDMSVTKDVSQSSIGP